MNGGLLMIGFVVLFFVFVAGVGLAVWLSSRGSAPKVDPYRDHEQIEQR